MFVHYLLYYVQKYLIMAKNDPGIPYNSLPNLPPKFDLETKRIMRKLARSRAALAEMKGMVQLFQIQPCLLIH